MPPSVCPESVRDSLTFYNHVFFSDSGASCGHSRIALFVVVVVVVVVLSTGRFSSLEYHWARS